MEISKISNHTYIPKQEGGELFKVIIILHIMIYTTSNVRIQQADNKINLTNIINTHKYNFAWEDFSKLLKMLCQGICVLKQKVY